MLNLQGQLKSASSTSQRVSEYATVTRVGVPSDIALKEILLSAEGASLTASGCLRWWGFWMVCLAQKLLISIIPKYLFWVFSLRAKGLHEVMRLLIFKRVPLLLNWSCSYCLKCFVLSLNSLTKSCQLLLINHGQCIYLRLILNSHHHLRVLIGGGSHHDSTATGNVVVNYARILSAHVIGFIS